MLTSYININSTTTPQHNHTTINNILISAKKKEGKKERKTRILCCYINVVEKYKNIKDDHSKNMDKSKKFAVCVPVCFISYCYIYN